MTAEFLVAAHALTYLNHKQCCVASDELAENICTNPARIRKVMLKLKNAGLIETRSGTNGGYLFTKNPSSVTLQDVLDATDGTIVATDWRSGNPHADCLVSSGMGGIMDDVLSNVNKTASSYLAKVSIKDIDKRIFSK